MPITTLKSIDLIQILPNGVIQVRFRNSYLQDSIEVAFTYERDVLVPGQAVVINDTRLNAVIDAIWTPEVIAAYQASVAE